jgi:nucleotidyltransferase substrate binding protein (TIGR01987 family)
MTTARTPRWVYRFENYTRAFTLLREAVETMETRPLSALEKEGVIQRFEYTWELAWKVLKDYLEYSGVVLETVTPASVLRAAFAARIITRGEVWMRALDDRNKMAHTYSSAAFEQMLQAIRTDYLPCFDALHVLLLEKIAAGEARA